MDKTKLKVKLSDILLAFSRAISITLDMGLSHTLQTAKIAYLIADKLKLNQKNIERLVISALLHDIGIASIKKELSLDQKSLNESDIFKHTDLDIIELLDFSKRNKMGELMDLIMAHSLEGAQFLKHAEIRKIINIMIEKDMLSSHLRENISVDDMAYLSKILCVSDLIECATNVEDTIDDKISAATFLLNNFLGKLLDRKLLEDILEVVKEKSFWESIVYKHLFDELFLSFRDVEYTMFAPQVLEFLQLFARFIDIKSPHTAKHSTNTAYISKAIAKEMGYDKQKCLIVYHAALVHDIGKLAISNTIIEKSGKLTEEEYMAMKKHPKITKEILAPLSDIKEIVLWAVFHHERLNGEGYPYGLDKDQIPEESMIIAVADVYEAMTADRPYRKGLVSKDALAYLKSQKNIMFNPECVDAIERLIKRNELNNGK